MTDNTKSQSLEDVAQYCSTALNQICLNRSIPALLICTVDFLQVHKFKATFRIQIHSHSFPQFAPLRAFNLALVHVNFAVQGAAAAGRPTKEPFINDIRNILGCHPHCPLSCHC